MPLATQPIADQLWRVEVLTTRDAADAIAAALEESSTAISAFERGDAWLVDAVLLDEPDRAQLDARLALAAMAVGAPAPAMTVEKLPPTDWLQQVYDSFPVRRLGRFLLRGSHLKSNLAPAPIVLTLDAGTAFGSGEHPTTEGCLRMLDLLAREGMRPRHVLDMGCGSGILALAAAKQWRRQVVAIDVDAESVRVARENARLNGTVPLVRAEVGNGYRAPIVRREGPYDLILANILARPLIRLAPDARRNLARGGKLVLSGLLQRQERAVLRAHAAHGFRLVRRCPIGEWQTLVLTR
ncbi:MAG: ribosomal protein methyltransferase [Rhodospirillales bacterium]|nr:ribosomal protein methyltransferase [Rhodospirillales bacterium]